MLLLSVKIIPISVPAGAFYVIHVFFMLFPYLIILYHFVFLQHFLRCHISLFNAGDLIAKAHINSLKGVRRNSQVTWGIATKLAFSLEFLCCAKQPAGQMVCPESEREMSLIQETFVSH